MSKGLEFYSGVKIKFSITSEVHIFANKEDLLWQALHPNQMELI